MKRILILSVLTMSSLFALSQTFPGDKLTARKSIQLRTVTIDSFQKGSNLAGKTRAVPTSDAVSKYVDAQISGIEMPLPAIDSMWRDGDSLRYRRAGVNYAIFRGSNNLLTSGGATLLYDLPANGINMNIVPMTKYGAAASSTITSVGGYDQITVPGGDATSVFEFANHQTAMGELIISFKVRIDSLGAAPRLGIQERDVPSGTYSNWSGFNYNGSVDLLNGHWTVPAYSRGTINSDSVNGFHNRPVEVGDVVEIVYHKIYGTLHEIEIIVTKPSGFEYRTSFARNICFAADGGSGDNHCYEGIVIADGKYTILGYKRSSPYANPFLAIIGDSLGSGARIGYSDQLVGWWNKLTNYRCALMGGPSSYLAGAQACINDIIKMRPKYVLISLWLDGAYGHKADPSDPGYAAFDSSFKRYISVIRSIGAKPIFQKVTSTAVVLGVTEANIWTAYIEAQFPTDLCLDLRGKTFTYDGTGFHFSSASNKMIIEELIKLLQSINAFSYIRKLPVIPGAYGLESERIAA